MATFNSILMVVVGLIPNFFLIKESTSITFRLIFTQSHQDRTRKNDRKTMTRSYLFVLPFVCLSLKGSMLSLNVSKVIFVPADFYKLEHAKFTYGFLLLFWICSILHHIASCSSVSSIPSVARSVAASQFLAISGPEVTHFSPDVTKVEQCIWVTWFVHMNLKRTWVNRPQSQVKLY